MNFITSEDLATLMRSSEYKQMIGEGASVNKSDVCEGGVFEREALDV